LTFPSRPISGSILPSGLLVEVDAIGFERIRSSSHRLPSPVIAIIFIGTRTCAAFDWPGRLAMPCEM
jgi:hypothetical protein